MKHILLVLVLLIASCAHMQDKFLQVRPGMSAAEVTQLLGNPEDRSFVNGEERWTYSSLGQFTTDIYVKIITMKDGKVVSLGNDEVAEQRLHEVEVAKAGATKIKINNGNSGIPPGGLGFPSAFDCSNSNIFGKYPTGGGCNTFGCWPAGGECTAFGCSANAHCGATNCPNKITKLQCWRS